MELIFVLVVALVLFAILIGALMPVLFQMKRTLSVAQNQLERAGEHADTLTRDVTKVMQRVDAMSEDVARVIKRVDMLTEGAEDAGPSVVQITESLRNMAETVDHLRDRLDGAAGISMSLVPAAVAAFQQWMAHREGQQGPQPYAGMGPMAPPPPGGFDDVPGGPQHPPHEPPTHHTQPGPPKTGSF